MEKIILLISKILIFCWLSYFFSQHVNSYYSKASLLRPRLQPPPLSYDLNFFMSESFCSIMTFFANIMCWEKKSVFLKDYFW